MAGRNYILDPSFRLEGLKFLHEQLTCGQKELFNLTTGIYYISSQGL